MRNYLLIKTWALISTILFIISLFCLASAIQTINTFEHPEPQYYTETEDCVLVTLSSGKCFTLDFRKTAVEVKRCASVSRHDALMLISFIKGYAKKNSIPISRATVELIGECRLHTMLSSIGYKAEQTDNADLDYTQDRRWYVNSIAKMIGVMGM